MRTAPNRSAEPASMGGAQTSNECSTGYGTTEAAIGEAIRRRLRAMPCDRLDRELGRAMDRQNYSWAFSLAREADRRRAWVRAWCSCETGGHS